MPRLPARALRFLRLSALLLLVLSLLARPMLEQMGDAHAVEHAVLAAADAGHDHDHPDHDPAQDPDHTKGLHGLMHPAECGTTAALSPTWGMALANPPAASPPWPDTATPRRATPATPFRPPIA